MGIIKILQSMFGNKSTRDMKLIQPYVDKVKKAYEQIETLDNDQLRAKTKEILWHRSAESSDICAKRCKRDT